MKSFLKMSFPAVVLIVLWSCAQPPPAQPPHRETPPPSYSLAPPTIHLDFKADSQLNHYQGSPHTLLVCVYQLRDPNGFNQLKEDNTGLSKLLACSPFDSSAVGAYRVIAQPGQESDYTLDIAEGARYVGIVAGYYVLKKENVVRLKPIPMQQMSTGTPGAPYGLRPGAMDIKMFLGPRELQDLGGAR